MESSDESGRRGPEKYEIVMGSTSIEKLTGI
jgi:hypothetical protein